MPNGGLHGDSDYGVELLGRELKELRLTLRNLCAHVERSGWSLTTEADEWWKKQKQEEVKEEERRKAKEDRERVAGIARGKLTPEERVALGLNREG